MCLDHENGSSYKTISRKYSIPKRMFEYMWHLYERHGPSSLIHKSIRWTSSQKEEAVKRVLDGESINSVALDIGLTTNSALVRWLKEYKQNGYTIVERKRGKPPMYKSSTKKKDNLTPEQKEIKDLKKILKELEIENEYLKKLDALVRARKAQQQKNKS